MIRSLRYRIVVISLALFFIGTLGPVTANAGWLYLLNDDPAGSRIYCFQTSFATGELFPVDGFPVATGGLGGNALVSERMTIDTLNNRLYVINDGSDTVSAYSINPTTGAITPLPFSPIALGAATWNSIAVHPSGSPLIVGDGSTTAGRAASFQITATTATPAAGSPFPVNPASPFSSVFSTDGNYFYIGGNSGSVIAGFSVNAGTGVLTPLTGSPFSTTTGNPVAHATDSSGRLYVVTTTPEIRVFTTSAGIPTGVTGNPFPPSGLTQRRDGLIHPNGNFYVVAGNTGNNVGVFQISGSGAATTLAAVAGSPFASGGTTANVIALNETGNFLFVGHRLSRNVTTFAFNPSTGVLSGQIVQPSNTLGTAGFICGIGYLPRPNSPIAVVAGRVTDSGGNGVGNVTLRLTGGTGELTAITNPFGYYSFGAIPTGSTHTLTPSRKGYSFTPPSITFNHTIDVTNQDFTAAQN